MHYETSEVRHELCDIVCIPLRGCTAPMNSKLYFCIFQGFIQFKEEGTAQKAIDSLKEANDGKVMINGVETTLRVVEG